MSRIKENLLQARRLLDTFIADDKNISAIEQAGKLMLDAIQSGGKIISCGNGGSMSDAMHLAEELTGRFRHHRRSLPAIAISDPAYITCAANDYGFEHVFSRFIEGVGMENDLLFCLSTSGNSANIINAAKAAKGKGMKIIALTGKEGGELAKLCDTEVRAPYFEFSDRTQEIHIKVIHCLIDYIEQQISE